VSWLPLIGVTISITVGKDPERAYVSSAYLLAVQEAGGAPVPLPPQLDGSALDEISSRLDALLLTGGGDINSVAFGEPLHPTCYDVAPSRDRLETTLVRRCLAEGKPILAICRGIQLLNVALGGSLYQDVASDPGTAITHDQDGPRDRLAHPVKVVSGSFLARVLEDDSLEVNSMHHQAVKALGKGLVAVAHAPDQIIEGVEMEDAGPRRFVLGVQWHPEELTQKDPTARALFAAFVSASRK
jgi:putative glutamine amidotransferase